MALKFVNEIELKDKNVIARFDFNVPLSQNKITDSTRIDLALETIVYILSQRPKKLILMSHLGRPNGEVKSEYSLEPVANYLAEKLNEEVILTESCTDRGINTLLKLNQTRIILLQNLRFHKEETSNDREFARTLSRYADIYVNDAFGAAHRKHASTYEINAFFKTRAVAGFLLQKEIQALTKIVEKPRPPFVAIIGGAKVSDKIKIIERLLTNVNKLLVGGAMAYPFLKAKGINIGHSLCRDEDIALAKKILATPQASKIHLPQDHIASERADGSAITINEVQIPAHLMGLDIGPKTIEDYQQTLLHAKTVLWNGPMGLFENENFSKGTFKIAEILSQLHDCFTLIGGGDSVSAVKRSGLSEKISHISTGGGASLEFIEKGGLPGIQALKFGIE